MAPNHARRHLHAPTGLADRLADGVVATLGSWRFLIVQTVIVGCWVTLNIAAVALRFDPYPFILLNLLFSTQAAYASPLILMAANRQAEKDRARDDLEAREVDELHQMNRTQLEILRLLHARLAPPDKE